MRDQLADWYIETSKASENPALLNYVLKNFLIICHPLAPFITEAIWQSLDQKDLLITKKYEKIMPFDIKKSENFNKLTLIVSELRLIKKSLDIKHLAINSDSELLNRNFEIIKKLANLQKFESNNKSSYQTVKIEGESITLNIDHDLFKNYLSDLMLKKSSLETLISNLNKRLQNKSYLDKAPKELVIESKEQLHTAIENLEIIKNQIDIFKQT